MIDIYEILVCNSGCERRFDSILCEYSVRFKSTDFPHNHIRRMDRLVYFIRQPSFINRAARELMEEIEENINGAF